jgi:phosphatidate cytidylyltransferase
MVQLRVLSGGPWGTDGRWGMLALVSLIATVKMSDIGQYTVGRLIGRHKLAPKISPGKTWEGVAGGVVFAAVTSAYLVFWRPDMAQLRTSLNWESARAVLLVRATVYGALLAVAGMAGDLAESLLKRDAAMKDSSEWMPGFGGVLDLLDSLLVAAPVAYLFWAIRWIGP